MDDHSLQAPFIFDFYQKVILSAKLASPIEEVEVIRANFLDSLEEIEIQDLGAGSTVARSKTRKISEIARTATSPHKVSQLLLQIGQFIEAKNVLELGTSLGITTKHLSMISKDAKVVTMEGSPILSEYASSHLNQLENVTIRTGNISRLLPEYISSTNQVDLAYVDANHTFEATIDYVTQIITKVGSSSVIVVGDIHWSDGMENAWSELKDLDQISLSVDLFHCGVLFVQPLMEKQHYVIEF